MWSSCGQPEVLCFIIGRNLPIGSIMDFRVFQIKDIMEFERAIVVYMALVTDSKR